MRIVAHRAKDAAGSQVLRTFLFYLTTWNKHHNPDITWANPSIDIAPGKTGVSSCRKRLNADNAVFSLLASWTRNVVRTPLALWESMRVVGVVKGNTYAVASRVHTKMLIRVFQDIGINIMWCVPNPIYSRVNNLLPMRQILMFLVWIIWPHSA